jgi:hypothetical protein
MIGVEASYMTKRAGRLNSSIHGFGRDQTVTPSRFEKEHKIYGMKFQSQVKLLRTSKTTVHDG